MSIVHTSSAFPNENIAASVVREMTHEKIVSSKRLTTGDQYFVFATHSTTSEYVIRMTTVEHIQKFHQAIYWQEKLIPLNIPLARFIKTDLVRLYSPFPALLMKRLPGDDLCNVYPNLTDLDKKNLAKEIVNIHAATQSLPDGVGYGIMNTYEEIPEYKSWYDFLINRLQFCVCFIKQNKIFGEVEEIISIVERLKAGLQSIPPRPCLWDVSERNVLIHNGKISGIVDVDDLCCGDPLFVLALTYVGLENEGYDVLYPNYWAEFLQLDKEAQLRLSFYRLFFSVVFMRKHGMLTNNNKKIMYDVERLKNIFQQSLLRIKKFGI